MDLERTVSELIKNENLYKLDEIRVAGLPVWCVLKYDVRRDYFVKVVPQMSVSSSHRRINKLEFIRTLLKSFLMFVRLLFVPKKIDNVVFGFSRLDCIEGEYIDRFVDPIIDCTGLKDNYVYFEYGKICSHPKPRKGEDKVIYTDFLYLFSILWSYIFSPLFLFCHYRKIRDFSQLLLSASTIRVSPIKISRRLLEFKCNSTVLYYIFKRLKSKRLFGVSRILFKHASFAAKKRNMPVYELQHGITMGVTQLYGGNYLPDIDPDYFLQFGESCPKTVFGIPVDHVINVGFAFLGYMRNKATSMKNEKTCLIISEPEISDLIIDATIILATNYPQMNFHIRRHPQEHFSLEQVNRINQYSNIKDVSNSENSFFVIMTYDYIAGENSSVLYEGLSMGKKVARLNICGLHPISRKEDDSFYYIDDVKNFGDFLNAPTKKLKEEVYSDFNINLFNSYLK